MGAGVRAGVGVGTGVGVGIGVGVSIGEGGAVHAVKVKSKKIIKHKNLLEYDNLFIFGIPRSSFLLIFAMPQLLGGDLFRCVPFSDHLFLLFTILYLTSFSGGRSIYSV